MFVRPAAKRNTVITRQTMCAPHKTYPSNSKVGKKTEHYRLVSTVCFIPFFLWQNQLIKNLDYCFCFIGHVHSLKFCSLVQPHDAIARKGICGRQKDQPVTGSKL